MMMNKADTATALGAMGGLAIIFYGMKTKRGFWFYFLMFLFVLPLFYQLGYALGSQDENEIDTKDFLVGDDWDENKIRHMA